jgi:tetratricopeptide (TPR) repeat protein
MESEEGLLFLLRRANLLEPDATHEQLCQFAEQMPAHYAAAQELLSLLGGLPLALDQAGAYLEATHCGLLTYLDLFRTRRTDLLRQRGSGANQHPDSVATTFGLAISATTQCYPIVRDLLFVCALLQPDAIPEELFRQGAEHLGPVLQAACVDSLEWNHLMSLACSYSLISRQPEEQTLSLHRLVQVVILDGMAKTEQRQWNNRVIHALDMVFPEVNPNSESVAWKQSERLLPHALLCLRRAETADPDLTLAFLAEKAAQYLRESGQYNEAEWCYGKALSIQEQLLGQAHPRVAATLNNLAVLYREQGRYAEAESCFHRALHIYEQALGPDHPEVATVLNNVTLIYGIQGRYAEAESHFHRALHIYEQALGPDHPQVASTLNNLANLYYKQGRYAQAEPMYQRARCIWEQTHGPDHPRVAIALNNLGELYFDQEQYTEAEPLLERALQIREHTLGLDHPYVASTIENLAELYLKQGKDELAEQLYHRALLISKQALAPYHPRVACSLIGLADLYTHQGNYAQAEPLYLQALRIREQVLGPEHPDTAQTLYDVARFQQRQGHLDEAISLAKRALTIRIHSKGEDHRKTD